MRKVLRTLLAVGAAALVLGGCSINRLAVRAVSGVLAGGGGGGNTFSREDDPELVGDALPFALKLYESLLDADPRNPELLLATGRTFVMYAYAFVQGPADMLPDTEADQQAAMRARAKKLFWRARDYVLRGLEERRPGFRDAIETGKSDAALALVCKDDLEYLYWIAAAWLSAFTTDPFDMELLVSVPRPLALLSQVNRWDRTWNGGAVHDILISFYGSAPADLGGDEVMARWQFARSIELSKGLKAGPYVALASSVCVRNQNAAEFRELLGKALAVNLDAFPDGRLENILSQRRAQWLLDHIGDYFLLEEGTE